MSCQVAVNIVAEWTRQNSTPGGSGAGGWAEPPVAAKEVSGCAHAGSRQTSTVTLDVDGSSAAAEFARMDRGQILSQIAWIQRCFG